MVWAFEMGPGSLIKYLVWYGTVVDGDRRIWAPLGTGPGGGDTFGMNDGILFLED